MLDVPMILIYVADLARMDHCDDWDKSVFPWADSAVDGRERLPLLRLRRPGHRCPRQVRPGAARGRHGTWPDHLITFSQPVGYAG